jgi:glycosyltransferase involved in cell wall biosynthesis
MREISKQNKIASQLPTDISVVILTYNEEIHIRRCIKNVIPWVQDVFVVDCFSIDRTVEIANELGARVFQNKWEGFHARQLNWALDHLPIKTKWVLRLDADEYVCPELIAEIKSKLGLLPDDVNGIVFNLRRVFMGRIIRRGMPKVKLLRLFRYGKARCEQRLMDEHIELCEGRSVAFDGEFADHNLNDIGWWTAKHNGYALREAVDLLDLEFGLLHHEGHEEEIGLGCGETQASRNKTNAFLRVLRGESTASGQTAGLGDQAVAKRANKMRYAKMPLFLRAFAYFLMRYVMRGGFLEGREGFLWHYLQGWWYRTLVDTKVFEIKRESGGDREKMLVLLRVKYGMKI